MHDINASSPDKPPSGDSLIKCLVWAGIGSALVVWLVFVFALGWPTLVSP